MSSVVPVENVNTDPVQLTRELIRIDSTTHTRGERDCLDFIAGIFSPLLGYRVHRVLDAEGLPTALIVGPKSVTVPELLLFSGHIDTVPAEQTEWERFPWSGDIDSGYVHGRGASDMKSGVAAQISAMIKAGPLAPVVLAVSTGEEDGCVGTPDVLRGLEEWGIQLSSSNKAGGAKRSREPSTKEPSIGAVIVGEPTDNRVVLGHKGLLWLTVETSGEPVHGSMPDEGTSAIYKMCDLIERARAELPFRTHAVLGRETMSVGTIQGGTATNVVPGACSITVDMRIVESDPRPLLDWWLSQPEVSNLTVDRHFSSVCTEPEDPWIRSLPVAAERDAMPFGTEAGQLDEALGVPPTAIWGPGHVEEMHVHDEKVAVDAILEAEGNYLKVIRDWPAK